jgi:hypothetical protein
MPLGASRSSPSTGGITYDNVVGVAKRNGMISERVAVTSGQCFATLSQTLPAGARVIWAAIKNTSAITPRIASTATTASGTGNLVLVNIAPTSLATGSTTSHLCLGPVQTAAVAAIAANSEGRGMVAGAVSAGINQNTGTSAQTLYLIPYAGTTAGDATQRYLVNTTATTVAYHLGTSTANVDINIYYEVFDSPPNV